MSEAKQPTKECSRCWEARPVSEFYINRQRSEFGAACKTCLRTKRRSRTAFERLMHRIVKTDGPDPCWIWPRAGTNGYGEITVNGRFYFAHRYIWAMTNGQDEIKGRALVRRCPERMCVNPDHMKPGYRIATVDMRTSDLTPYGQVAHDAEP